MLRRICGFALLASLAAGCGDDAATDPDAGITDRGAPDRGARDLPAEADAAPSDADLADSAPADTAPADGVAPDGGAADGATCTDGGTFTFTPEVHRTFEGATLGALANSDPTGFDGLLGGVDHVDISDVTAADGSKAARFFMQASNTGDQGAVIRLPSPIGKGEIWIRTYAYFPAGYAFVGNTEGQKFLRADMRASDGTYRGAWDHYVGANGAYLATGITAGDIAKDFYANHCAWADGSPCRGFGPDVTLGQWHYYEYYIKLTEVTEDGIIRAWADGKLYFEATGLKTLPNATDGIFQLKIFSGPQPGVYSQDQYAYIDEVVIASSASPPQTPDGDGNTMIGGLCAP